MAEETEIRLIALETAVREMLPHMPTDFGSRTLGKVDKALERLPELSDEHKADFMTFRGFMSDLLVPSAFKGEPPENEPIGWSVMSDPRRISLPARSWIAWLLATGRQPS